MQSDREQTLSFRGFPLPFTIRTSQQRRVLWTKTYYR